MTKSEDEIKKFQNVRKQYVIPSGITQNVINYPQYTVHPGTVLWASRVYYGSWMHDGQTDHHANYIVEFSGILLGGRTFWPNRK